MARVITGDVDVFRASMYGPPQQSVINHVRNHLYSAAERMGAVGQSIIQYAEESIDRAVNSDAYRLANAALRRVATIWDVNEIRALRETWQVQNAKPVMMEYIMAEPTIRRLYQQGLCEGYGNEYFDPYKQDIGENHVVWQRAMDGLVTIGGEDDDFDWYSITYGNSHDETVDLLFEEQLDIQETWETVRESIRKGVDPTSRYDSDL